MTSGAARDELKRTFSTVAQEYARGRPRYGQAAVAAMVADLDRPITVVDLGAGSGQLALPLADAGARVTAVEPLAPAREILAVAIGDRRHRGDLVVEVVAGAAEAIPLMDSSADLITCADSFHWFDAPRAVAEIVRVLRPGGRCCVSQLVPAWTPEQSVGWADAIGELIIPIWVAGQHPHNDGTDPTALAHPRLGPVDVLEVPCVQRTGHRDLVDYFSSISVVAILPDDERNAFRADVAALLDHHDVHEVDLTFIARLWLTSRR